MKEDSSLELGWGLISVRRHGEILVVIGIVFIVGLLVLPLPPFLLDLLLALSISSALVVLLVALYTDHPLDFSSFPVMLLLLTLYRLALNVSSTRLILGRGSSAGLAGSGAGCRSRTGVRDHDRDRRRKSVCRSVRPGEDRFDRRPGAQRQGGREVYRHDHRHKAEPVLWRQASVLHVRAD